jgi:hypothetical protein
MKTDKQVSNAYDRAATLAWNTVKASQETMFAATPAQMSSERGAAQCAAGMAAQALAKLENGDYEGFLTSMRLAGGFANDASDSYFARKPINWK